MKRIVTLLLLLLMPAGASELHPSEAVANVIRRAHGDQQEDLFGVDYAMVSGKDKSLTKQKIRELFLSIDPAKLSFGKYDYKTGIIDMLEPKKIRFTLQSRASSSKDVITSIASYRVIVGIELSPSK